MILRALGREAVGLHLEVFSVTSAFSVELRDNVDPVSAAFGVLTEGLLSRKFPKAASSKGV